MDVLGFKKVWSSANGTHSRIGDLQGTITSHSITCTHLFIGMAIKRIWKDTTHASSMNKLCYISGQHCHNCTSLVQGEKQLFYT